MSVGFSAKDVVMITTHGFIHHGETTIQSSESALASTHSLDREAVAGVLGPMVSYLFGMTQPKQ